MSTFFLLLVFSVLILFLNLSYDGRGGGGGKNKSSFSAIIFTAGGVAGLAKGMYGNGMKQPITNKVKDYFFVSEKF